MASDDNEAKRVKDDLTAHDDTEKGGEYVDASAEKHSSPLQNSNEYRARWYQLWKPSAPPPAPLTNLDDAPIIPIANASFLSMLLFTWVTPLLSLGWHRSLETGDLWKMDPSREASFLSEKLNAAWDTRVMLAKEHNVKLEQGVIRPRMLKRVWWRLTVWDEQKRAELSKAWYSNAVRRASLVLSLNDVYGRQFWVSGLFKVVGDVAQLMGPIISKQIIRIAQERNAAKLAGRTGPSIGRGAGAAVGLFLITISASICQHQWFWRSMSTGVLARASLINSLYRRGLALTPKARTIHPNGALVNHLSTDVSRIDYAAQWFHPSWTSVIQVIVCLIILCIQLGPSALAGFSLFLILTPIQERAMRYQLGTRRVSMQYTDQRAGLLQELLGSMRIIKYFTYEVPFLNRISELRRQELRGIRALLVMRAGTQAIAFSIPVLASVLAFVVYSLSGHPLDPAIIFTSLSLFSLLRQPLMFLPRALSSITDGQNALGRIQKVLEAEVLGAGGSGGGGSVNGGKSGGFVTVDDEGEVGVRVVGGEFKWEAPPPDLNLKGDGKGKKNGGEKKKGGDTVKVKETTKEEKGVPEDSKPFELNGVELDIPRGTLCAVVGPVGSGKSSLVQGLIGEMRQTNGNITLGGRLAYCAQTPWIQNATLRDNVLFGSEFEEGRYWKAVAQASLMADLMILPDGDMTEIGEKGINLSGGQKSRVNIARALYNDADIFCFDDILSALDAHVSERVFREAILPLKAHGKTVILVTHALHLLPELDYIYSIANGRIVEQGRYEDLLASGGVFAALVKEFGQAQAKKEEEDVEDSQDVQDEGDGLTITAETKAKAHPTALSGKGKSEPKEEKEKAEGTGKVEGLLMKAEQRKRGAISRSVYLDYGKAGGGAYTLPLILLSGIFMQSSQLLNSYWLVWWQEENWHLKNGVYMGIYAALGVAQALATFALGGSMSWLSYLASARMHGNSVRTIFHAPMAFFDTVPLGRLLGVLGKDIDTIDNTLSDSLRMLAITLSSLLGSVILITILFHYFLPIIFIIAIGYVLLARFYNKSARELKRLDAIMRSNLYAHFAESLSGLATIRAYGETSRFIAQNAKFIDYENRALFITITNQRWLSIRLDGLGGLLTFAVAIMAVVGLNGVSAAQVGLALTYTVNITAILGVVTRQTAEVENNMNAVERVHSYSDEGITPQEASYNDPPSMQSVSSDWPRHGKIEFRDVVMSYRPGLAPVLKGVSLVAHGGQKIGVVGRTGAGKSSLMGALFRLMELSSGSIVIDGVDITTLGLRRLRSKMAIIPQDPLLFSGTVRSNLDPFNEHTDARLNDALRRAHLIDIPQPSFELGSSLEKPTSSRRTFSLDMPVDAEGANLSLGERSLLSLARALCKDAKIVVMDEATASVDVETDSKIQETILSEFVDKTLLCIAHRLRTVIGYDKILVLDHGEVVEFDTPLKLYRLQDGYFRQMCDRSHIVLE